MIELERNNNDDKIKKIIVDGIELHPFEDLDNFKLIRALAPKIRLMDLAKDLELYVMAKGEEDYNIFGDHIYSIRRRDHKAVVTFFKLIFLDELSYLRSDFTATYIPDVFAAECALVFHCLPEAGDISVSVDREFDARRLEYTLSIPCTMLDEVVTKADRVYEEIQNRLKIITI